jgi:hypothetical protein
LNSSFQVKGFLTRTILYHLGLRFAEL